MKTTQKAQIPGLNLNNSKEIPILGLGTWDLHGQKCITAVKEAIKLGYRHIDTAQMYKNETEIGQAISSFPREKLFLVSKVWPTNLTYNGVLYSIDKSLSNLQTDYLDLYLIHWPPNIANSKNNQNLKQALQAFKEIHQKGKIKAFGVSNFSIDELQSIFPIAKELNLKISVNQIPFNPREHDDELVQFCKENDIVITAYSPLDQGRAIKEIKDNAINNAISRTINKTTNNAITMMAKKYKKTPSQIILRWIIQRDTHMTTIPKASTTKHLKENMNIFNFKISDPDMKLMNELKNE